MADNNEEYFEYWPGVSGWSRRTVADGIWLNNNTVRPITERTDILKDAIKVLSANTDEHFDNLEMYMYEEFENTSAYIDNEISATKDWTLEQIGLAGGFVVTEGTSAGPTMDASAANPKKIYLVPLITNKKKRDLYSEWIVTSEVSEPEPENYEWTCIGETVLSLGGYINNVASAGNGKFIIGLDKDDTISGATLSATYGNVSTSDLTDPYSGASGIVIDSSNHIGHSASITPGNFGLAASTTASAVSLPYVTYDAEGHISAVSSNTFTLPTGTTAAAGILKLGTAATDAASGDHKHLLSDVTDFGTSYSAAVNDTLTSGVVRTDITQSLSTNEKATARSNIDVPIVKLIAGGTSPSLSSVLFNYHDITGATTVSGYAKGDFGYENYGYLLRPDDSTYAGKVPVATWENNRGGINWENINGVKYFNKSAAAATVWPDIKAAIEDGYYPVLTYKVAAQAPIQYYSLAAFNFDNSNSETIRFQRCSPFDFLVDVWELYYDKIANTYSWNEYAELSLIIDGYDFDMLDDNPQGSFGLAITELADNILAQEKIPVLHITDKYSPYDEHYLTFVRVDTGCNMKFIDDRINISISKIDGTIFYGPIGVPAANYANTAGTATVAYHDEYNDSITERSYKYAPYSTVYSSQYTDDTTVYQITPSMPYQTIPYSSNINDVLPIVYQYLQTNSNGTLKKSDGWRDCIVTYNFSCLAAADDTARLTFELIVNDGGTLKPYCGRSAQTVMMPGQNILTPIHFSKQFTIHMDESGNIDSDIGSYAKTTNTCEFAFYNENNRGTGTLVHTKIWIEVLGRKYVATTKYPNG